MRPCATTPLPSRKRSGRRPVYTTGTLFAVSVTVNRTVSASFSLTTLPASTSPPMRNARSRGASLAATCVGVRKNTRFDWNAFNTRAEATPSAACPATIHAARLVLGFKLALLIDAALRARAPQPQCRDLDGDRDCQRAVRHREVEGMVCRHAKRSSLTHCVRRSRSRMIARTRTSDAAIEYIQKPTATSSIPQSIATCIDVPLKLTLEPWCSVFHHWTEK